MDNIREKLFKNITNIIAVITAILAIILAIIKLLSYSYWKGYLTFFNINSDYIRLNNDNIILELVFYGILMMALLYFSLTTYEFIGKNMKKVANEKAVLKKIGTFLRLLPICIFVSVILMTSINIPLLWASVISFNISRGRSFTQSLAIAYFIEMFTMFGFWITDLDKRTKRKGTEQNEEVIQSRLATKILLGIIIVTFIIAGLYKLGIESANKNSDYEIVNGGEFIIAYKYDDKCILLSSEIDNDSIIIEKNKQKISDIHDIEYEIVTFNNIMVK